MLHAHGVLTHYQWLEVFDGGRNSRVDDPRLTHPIDALIRFYNDKKKVAMTAPNRIGFDVADFHGSPLSR